MRCRAVQKVLRKTLDYPHPVYIRIPRGEEPLVYTQDFDYDYEIGKAIVIQEGTDLNIIAAGMGVYSAVQAPAVLKKKGYSVGVIDMHTIKPIDKEAVIRAAKSQRRHYYRRGSNILGGLGSIVADVLMEAGVFARLKKIGIPDTFAEIGYPEELYPYYGMDGDGVTKTALEFLEK